MTDETVLTKEMAERFLADPDDVDLKVFTTIEDAAAEILSKYKGRLYLSGLTSLSDAAAESLGRHVVSLSLSGLTTLSDTAKKSLRHHYAERSR